MLTATRAPEPETAAHTSWIRPWTLWRQEDLRTILDSSRLQARTLLAIAIGLGAFMRFHKLAKFEMTADEGASWLAAAAPNVHQVVDIQRWADAGKLAVYDLALHGWIRFFGDGMFAMRAMSALLGTVAIVLVFLVVRELCLLLGGSFEDGEAELAGAFAGLLFATNLMMSTMARSARMYPMMIAAQLAQLLFFLRLHRRAGVTDYAATAAFTALAIAVNFTAAFLLAAEGAWIVGLALVRWRYPSVAPGLSLFRPTAATMAGLALLAPAMPAAAATSKGAVDYGAIDWIKPQPLLWPIHVFKELVEKTWLLRFLLVCIAYAVWRHWRMDKGLIAFLALWVVAPIGAVLLVSWTIHPLEVSRYVVIAFVGFLALAGLGMASFRNILVRAAIVVLVVSTAIKIDHSYLRRPSDAAWREATIVAAREIAPGQKIVVFPAFAADVVQYYLGPGRRQMAIEATDNCQPNAIIVLSGVEITPPQTIAALRRCYPRMVAQLREIEVRSQ
jgi:hypothetical protein